MAFCTKCGKELRDGDRFCFYCGAPVRGANGNSADYENRDREIKNRGNFSNYKWIIGVIAAAVILLAAVFFLMRGGKESDSGAASDIQESLKSVDGTDIMDGTDNQTENKSGGEPSVSDQLEQKTDYSAETLAAEVIKEIENQSGFVTDSYWEPLAAADDFNGDGVQELLTVYEMKDGAGINVMYDLWSLRESGAQELKSEVLFKEVGGNNGIVGIVMPKGEPLLAVYRYEPEGDIFNNYYTYFSLEGDESAFGDSGYYLECHGNYEQEEQGRYILGDTAVEMSEFNAKYDELTQWMYELDLMEGAKGRVKTFDEMK